MTSSTKRVNILPVRKPLNIQYSFPLAPSLFKLARSPPIKLSRRLPCDAPNLGTPFSYNDEFHAALPSSVMFEAAGPNGEELLPIVNFLRVDIGSSRTTSSSYSESEESIGGGHAQVLAPRRRSRCSRCPRSLRSGALEGDVQQLLMLNRCRVPVSQCISSHPFLLLCCDIVSVLFGARQCASEVVSCSYVPRSSPQASRVSRI